MEYFDEEVISAMHIKRREEYGNIEEGLYIQNSLTLFHKVLLFEDKLSVMLPNEFSPKARRTARANRGAKEQAKSALRLRL